MLRPAVAGELAESLWRAHAGSEGTDRVCVGAYVEPTPPMPRTTDNAAQPVEVDAPSATSSEEHVQASGGVVVRQGNRRLAAQTIGLDRTTSLARADGGVWFSEPGVYVTGTTAGVDLSDGHVRIADAEFVLTDIEVRGYAQHMDRREDTVDLEGATLTRCPPDSRAWRVRARSIHVDRDFATARGARLVVGGVPVLYAPYLRLPVTDKRTSGFLFPGIGYDGEAGIDLSLPYYFNLAPNYDATLSPRLIGKRGAGIEGEFRHLNEAFETTLGGAFLSGDRRYDGHRARRDAGPGDRFSPADRWSVQVDSRGRVGRLRTRVDYAAVSDNDYLDDLGGGYASLRQVSLERRAELRYARGNLTAGVLAQGFQRLEPGREPFRRMPELSLGYVGALPGPLSWSLGTSWTSFRGGDGGAQGDVTGDRLHTEPRLRLSLRRSWGFLNLAGGVRHTAYELRNTPVEVDSTPERNIRLGVMDAGLFLERPLARRGWVQTLEPRLHYLRQSHAEQHHLPQFDAAHLTSSYAQLFRDNRFAGLDRIADANRVSLGVESRLLNDRGAEILSMRVGGAGHLESRRVSSEESEADVVAEVRGSRGRFSVLSKVAWDTGRGDSEEFGLALSYRVDAGRVVNVGYRRRHPEIDQTDVSVLWPFSGAARGWRAFARWNHDWRDGQMIEGFAGFAYANCCIDIKLLWHRTLDVPRNLQGTTSRLDSGVLVQIAFRGFAGLGRRVDSRLVRGIKGYRPGDP